MVNIAEPSSKRVLEPIERISEVLFGIIMVLTFTGALSVAQAGREDVRTMMLAALGCNLAWGLIDGIMYLMGCLADQARKICTVVAVRKASQAEQGHRIIRDALPAAVAPVLQTPELERMRLHLVQLPELPGHPKLTGRDWIGASGVFLLVFLSTFPVVLPFAFIEVTSRAMRLSNVIAILMLFVTGSAFGRCTGYHPWRMGIVMVLLGGALVGMTIALGG